MDFSARYKKLNDNQRKAVDTINGPVMVIAGPGTGKTELLSMRAANILQKTDTLPENILCLTFTESGAHAMRERLASIIGKDAYRVAIHTFHSFGSEIINQNGEFFYHGAHFRPADDLAVHQIIKQILDELDYGNPLAKTMNGDYTYLRDIITAISDLKRSGLTSDELLQILDANDILLDAIEPEISALFDRRISATTLAQFAPLAHKVANFDTPPLPNSITPLNSTLALSIAHAVDAATDSDSTKPVTAWKNKWLTKNEQGKFIFKDRSRHEKLRALSYVYFQYLAHMQEAELYDYDDMILRVVHALEVFDDLRFNLQEKFQYIMVDEFQDTNLAQMRILENLTNNPVHEDTPNILVVGDDDQAIYSFQGADISNILSFKTRYSKSQIIPLIDNYRSGEAILSAARAIITQGSDRLERHIEELDKTLSAHVTEQATATVVEAQNVNQEHEWLATTIKEVIREGKQPSDIAVLTRKHSEIKELLPVFAAHDIAVSYEKRDNVFELEPIVLLTRLSRVITKLAEQKIDEADKLLPELLSHPAWKIDTKDLWRLSLKAYDARSRWLDTMETLPVFKELQAWFIEQARLSSQTPLEQMIDELIGVEQKEDGFVSPLYAYFFSPEKLKDNPDVYIRFLEALRTIRTALREHYDGKAVTLSAFLEFSDLYEQAGSTLTSTAQHAANQNAINLMTAHKSKGLEFDAVFIPGAVESIWGAKVRGRSRLISYPENLPLATAGDSPDERLRLFFVAATRAKRQLIISYATTTDVGKPLEKAGFLLDQATVSAGNQQRQTEQQITQKPHWYTRAADATRAHDLKTVLQPILDTYKLSATHLGTFLDITRGGPQAFLVHNLLRFPQAMSPAAAYGSAIHATLQRAHTHLTATKKQRAIEDILHDYETELAHYRLSEHELEQYNQKGIAALQAFLAARYDSFNSQQKVELNFAGQQSLVGEVHLTGKLDLVDIDTATKQIVVTDYKTGHPSATWSGKSDYEKAKLHRYKQQLMFYKLLVEHSRDYHAFTVESGVLQFVEPNKQGEILSLASSFTTDDIQRFTQLIAGVWGRITTLNLPNTDHYEPTFKGILAFEQDIIDNKI